MVRGTIKNGDETLLESIEISLTTIGGSYQQSSWSGSFHLPDGKYIDPERYRLELDDGRVGEMIVIRTDDASAWFQGTGELAKPK